MTSSSAPGKVIRTPCRFGTEVELCQVASDTSHDRLVTAVDAEVGLQHGRKYVDRLAKWFTRWDHPRRRLASWGIPDRMKNLENNAAFTGQIPVNYHNYLGPFLFEFSAADIAKRVASGLDSPVRVLEVACGTGISTRHLARMLPAGSRIVATDLNPAMLDYAADVNGDVPNVTYQQADALDLPFADDEFDRVVCQYGVMFFPDKARGLSEMARVLRPGGLVALNVWNSMEENPHIIIVDKIIKSFFKSDPPDFYEIPYGMHDVGECKSLLSLAGFEGIEVRHVAADVEIKDYLHPARGFVTGNPSIIQIEERATANPGQIVAAVAQGLEDAYGPAPAKIRCKEIVFQALKPAA